MQFQLHKDGQQVAKSLSELRALAREGKLAQDEWLYDERTQSWLGAAQVPELKDAWNIGEEDRTVSLQVSPELLAALAAQQAARSAPRAMAAASVEAERFVPGAAAPHEPEPASSPVAAPAAPKAPAAAVPAAPAARASARAPDAAATRERETVSDLEPPPASKLSPKLLVVVAVVIAAVVAAAVLLTR